MDAAGIDYLIGDPADRGRGLGSALVRAFVEDVLFPLHPGWSQGCASPQSANVGSWRALAQAGFSHLGTFDDPKVGPCRLMVRHRPPS